MTTKFMYERDPSGAPGDVLPFSDLTMSDEIVTTETVTFNIPATNSRYVVELFSYPATSMNNNIAIQWNYYAPTNLTAAPSGSVITTGERCTKHVQGGSTIKAIKVRTTLAPPITENAVNVLITLYSEGN